MDNVNDILQRLRDEPTGAPTPAPSADPAPTSRKGLILGAIGVAVVGLLLVAGPALRALPAVAGGTASGATGAGELSSMFAALGLPAGLPGAAGTPATAPVNPAPAPTASVAATTAGAEDWLAIVRGLTQQRMQAIEQRDLTLLNGIYTPGAREYVTDLGLIAGLQSLKWRAPKVDIDVHSVQERWYRNEGGVARVSLVVRDAMPAYDVLDDKGSVVRHLEARSARDWSVLLERGTDGTWRYAEVLPLTQ